jgi:hypothetical protein
MGNFLDLHELSKIKLTEGNEQGSWYFVGVTSLFQFDISSFTDRTTDLK